MSDVTRWWWIRHAPVDSGGRIYGNGDLPADCSDDSLFTYLATCLPRDAVWVTSQLQRTHQTAAAIARHLAAAPATPVVERRFAEQSFGDWQGLSHDELRRRRTPQWHRFWIAPAHERPPGGESFVDLTQRVRAGIGALTAAHAGRDIVCVAHGGTIRAALGIALDLAPERALAFAVDNCSLTRIEHFAGSPGSHDEATNEAWRVTLVNFPPQRQG
jgi:broad specificity phosphatase PhoE